MRFPVFHLKKAHKQLARTAVSLFIILLVIFIVLPPFHTQQPIDVRIEHKKIVYEYDKWKDVQKIKGSELLFLDGDLDSVQRVFCVDKYDNQIKASKAFLMDFVYTSGSLMDPPKNWWSMAGVGDVCLIEDKAAPRHGDPNFSNDAKWVPLLPLDEHCELLRCKMGNLVFRRNRLLSRKEEWDAIRLLDKIFYEPVALSSSIPDISWTLKRRPSGWLLTLDQVPKDSFYFLQGTGLALKRVGGGDRDVRQPDGQIAVVYDPYRSAEIRIKKGEQKQELLLNVVGPDRQKQVIKVDIRQSPLGRY
jgi:hypothetical protein